MKLNIVVFGLSITSSWGNGHATTYRALLKALAARGHTITFLERDVPWYRAHRDLRASPYCDIALYKELREVPRRFGALVAAADVIMLGSYVPDGVAIGDWITRTARGTTAFYDIDTPVTLARIANGSAEEISAALIPRFDLYLSFTGGPVLDLIEEKYGSPRARALHCAVDPDCHAPVAVEPKWTLGYIGTYSADRQPTLDRLLVEAARRMPKRRFVVAGPQYPNDIAWPANVDRVEHLAPRYHAAFYCAQKYTLNVTRSDMISVGYSPSVRLFEAAACGVPVISDRWPGIESFFVPDEEILIADKPRDVLDILRGLPERRRREVAEAARRRVLREHTADRRARQLEEYVREASGAPEKGQGEPSARAVLGTL